MEEEENGGNPGDRQGLPGSLREEESQAGPRHEAEQRRPVIRGEVGAEDALQQPAKAPDRPAQIVKTLLLPDPEAFLVEIEGKAPVGEIVAETGRPDEL